MENSATLPGYFGDIVRNRRNHLGVSQEELAERAGLHRTYIADIERGVRNPSLRTIDKVARALDVSISELFSAEAHDSQATPETVELLLVEDNPHDVRLTLRAFRKAKMRNRVKVVTSGQEALEYLLTPKSTRRRPHLILLDLNLPLIHGVEVLRQIKDNECTRSIPVVVLTASDEDRDMEECRRLGVAAYIVKPVDFHNFSQVVPQLRLSWMLLQLHTNAGTP